MNRKPSILVIFLSVFIDLVGFGIVLPLLPGFTEDNFRSDFSFKGFCIGAIIGSFSAMQFFFAPAWGKLSDRIGRRPVMLISNLGAAGSYVLFAVGCSFIKDNPVTENNYLPLGIILLSRLFAGICGANLSVASAYIADISPPEKRSARMGLIGMAFGLGFIFGPAIGAFSAELFGKQGPGWVAAAFCASNFVLGWFILGESRQPSSAKVTPRPKLNQWGHTLAQPKLGLLVGIFTCFESTFPLLAKHRFIVGTQELNHRIGYLFTYAGVIAALVQGVIGRLVKKFGEPGLIFTSLIIFAAGLGGLPFANTMPEILVVLALLAIGSGLNRPPVFGMISLNSSPDEQGANLGVAQSFGALARMLGPVFASTLFFVQPALPYLICGGIALLTSFVAWHYLHRAKAEPMKT
jgi:MFS family permease